MRLKHLVPGVDGRTAAARRFRDIALGLAGERRGCITAGDLTPVGSAPPSVYARSATGHPTTDAGPLRQRLRHAFTIACTGLPWPSSDGALSPFRAVLRAREEMYRGRRVAGGGDRRDSRPYPRRAASVHEFRPRNPLQGGALQVAIIGR
jgi:hypothetical protein